jgi:hypothetical protein
MPARRSAALPGRTDARPARPIEASDLTPPSAAPSLGEAVQEAEAARRKLVRLAHCLRHDVRLAAAEVSSAAARRAARAAAARAAVARAVAASAARPALRAAAVARAEAELAAAPELPAPSGGRGGWRRHRCYDRNVTHDEIRAYAGRDWLLDYRG